MAETLPTSHARVMKLRLVGGALWAYAAWYAWSMYAAFAGINPVIGALVAGMVLGLVAAGRVRAGYQRDRAERQGQNAAPPATSTSTST